MKDICILIIKIELSDGIYKIASVFRAKDKSFYIAFPSKGIAKSIDKEISNIKFSYHTSGKNHLKLKKGQQTVCLKYPDKVKFEEIEGIISTNYSMSFWDINTINGNTVILDRSESKHSYQNSFILDAEKYKHLTIRFFLGQKGYTMPSDARKRYKDMYIVNLEDIDLVVGIQDEWTGGEQTPRKTEPHIGISAHNTERFQL